MRKFLTLLTLCSLSSLTIQAAELEKNEMKEKKSDFYVAAKALVTLGNTITEEEATLDGGVGKGFGIDLGYRIANGFAVEVDATYDTNTVTEEKDGIKEDYTGTYLTSSFDVVYAHELVENLELFGKIGYEIEYEKIDTIADSYESTTGFIYAAGMEYEVAESVAVLAEYEVTTIDGPRGNSVFLGMLYNF